MVTKFGQCIKYNTTDVRRTGRNSIGVRGIKLSAGDEVVGMQLNTQGEDILIVSEKGMGKRTSIDEFKVQNRGGKGVKCYKISEKTGYVVGVKAVNDDNAIMLITNEGIIIQFDVEDISTIGRNTSGVKLMNIDKDKDIFIASIAKVREDINQATVSDDSVGEYIPDSDDENAEDVSEENVEVEESEE